MGCGCGKKTGEMQYVFIAQDGTETVKRTEVEVRAMVIRAERKGEIGKWEARKA